MGKLDNNGITHFNVDDNDEDKDILRTTKTGGTKRHGTRTSDCVCIHCYPQITAITADICGELVLTADSGARSVMTVPRQRSTRERANAAIDDATGTSKKRLQSVRDKTLKVTVRRNCWLL